MRTALGSFRYAVLVFLAIFLVIPARPQDRPPAMSENDLTQLLKIQMPDSQIISGIKKLGINFEMTPERERKFRRAGADDDVIAALNAVSKPTGGTTTPSTSTGGMEIHTQPGEAQVYLNDELKGMSSPEGRLRISGLAPGSYEVRVSLPGYQSWQRSVSVSSGETANVMAPLAQSGGGGGGGGGTTTIGKTTTSSTPSAIPLPDVKVDEVKFFESGASMPKVDERTYGTVYSSGTAREINYELNLSWGKISSRVDFNIDAVWYDPSHRVIFRNTHAAHVEPDWNGESTHADTYGCETAPCNAWATPGTYIVELFVTGVKVATGAFQITGGGSPSIGTTSSASTAKTFMIGAVPLPNVSLYSLKLFESGQGTPDEDKRAYTTVFPKASTRYINWELRLRYGSISSPVDWDTYTSWYGPDGSVFARTTVHTQAKPDWNGGLIYLDGWGCNTSPCSAWTKTGTYKIEIYVRGSKVASATFEVQ